VREGLRVKFEVELPLDTVRRIEVQAAGMSYTPDEIVRMIIEHSFDEENLLHAENFFRMRRLAETSGREFGEMMNTMLIDEIEDFEKWLNIQ
jgi:hypothetical protein